MLLDIKSFLGRYHLELSGGETYINKGFLDLIEFCHDRDILWGVTTNGSAFRNDAVVRRTVAARPLNVNISIDSGNADVHDYSRGIDGSFERISKGINKLIAERAAAGADFSIIIKAVVHRLNFRLLPELVTWCDEELGATAVNFQPVGRWSPESRTELWISAPDELHELTLIGDRLNATKQAGASILNTSSMIGLWEKHFRGESAPHEAMARRIGMRNLFIHADGNIALCSLFRTVGNVHTHSIRDIWYGAEADEIRRQTVECERLCLSTCLSRKTLADKVKMGVVFLGCERKNRSEAQ